MFKVWKRCTTWAENTELIFRWIHFHSSIFERREGKTLRRFFFVMVALIFTLTFSSVLKLAILVEPKALNVWVDYGPHANTWSKYVFASKYRSLYRFSHVTMDFIPDLAEDLPKVSREGSLTVYTIKLRKDLKWSDGTSITSRDVVFTLNSAAKLIERAGLSGNWVNMVDPHFFARAEAVGSRTVKIYLKKTGFLRVEYGILMAPIIQKKFWEKYVMEVLNAEKKIDYLYSIDTSKNPDPASGPFILERWEKGAFIQLKAIKNYFDKGCLEKHYENGAIVLTCPNGYRWNSKPEGGKEVLRVETGPFVDEVIYRVYQNVSSAVQALKAGEVDFVLNPSGIQEGDVASLRGSNVKIIENESINPRYLAFNLDRSPQKYRSFRKAISYILDIDFLTKRVFAGGISPIDSLVPRGNKFWHAPVEIVNHRLSHDQRMKKAYQILKDSGFHWIVEPKFLGNKLVRKGKGLIDPQGTPVKEMKLLAPTESYDPMRSIIALYLEKWANDLGIPIKTYFMDFKVIIRRAYYDRDFDMFILGWGPVKTPDHLINYLYSKSMFNVTHYSNPKFDSLVEKLLSCSNLNEARKIAFKMQEMITEDLPYIPLFVPEIVEAFSSNLVFPYTKVQSGLQSVYGLIEYVKKIK